MNFLDHFSCGSSSVHSLPSSPRRLTQRGLCWLLRGGRARAGLQRDGGCMGRGLLPFSAPPQELGNIPGMGKGQRGLIRAPRGGGEARGWK